MVTIEPTPPQPRPASLHVGAMAAAWGVVRTGRLRRAARLLADLEPSSPVERAQHGALLLTCQLGLGELAAAIATGEALAPLLEAGGATGVLARLAHADLAAALGDHGTALAHLTAAGMLPGAEDPDLPAWRASAAIASVWTGDRATAVRLAREELALAEERGDVHRLATALRTLAIVDSGVDPVRTLRRALGLARHTDDLRLIAQVGADLAALMLLSSGDHGEVLELLRSAETFAATEGLTPLHARVQDLLDRVGEESVTLEESALALLTHAEQRVARLAARGLTNREIAQQLAVSVKGVEWHLSRVYRKLGIGSRAGLGALLEAV